MSESKQAKSNQLTKRTKFSPLNWDLKKCGKVDGQHPDIRSCESAGVPDHHYKQTETFEGLELSKKG